MTKFSAELSEFCLKLAKLLLNAGGDLNAVNNDGETPLMIAVKQVTKMLV